MKQSLIAVLMLGLMVAGAWAGSGMDMKEGQWEMTVETEIAGMPMKMPPMSYMQCITKNNPVPENNQPDQQCKMTDMKTSGNTVTWAIKCDTPDGETTGTGKVTYLGDKMNGTMVMETQGMKITTRMNGHHVGPCKK